MAVGDVVNAVSSGTGTISFQPAAGVEIIILFTSGLDTGRVGLTTGANTGQTYTMSDSIGDAFTVGGNCKIGINNSVYLSVYSSTGKPAYSGIQIK